MFENLGVHPDTRNLYIDVGTSIDAPNSAHWFLEDEKAFVIAVEQSQRNRHVLAQVRPPAMMPYLRTQSSEILYNGEVVGNYGTRFTMLPVAIDDVDTPQKGVDFYIVEENTGCSSLLRPKDSSGFTVQTMEQVDVIPLSLVFESVDWGVYNHVEILKTDCQGKDFDVLRSAGSWLEDRVKILRFEHSTPNGGQYENEQDSSELRQYLSEQGFVPYRVDHTDATYVNKGFAL